MNAQKRFWRIVRIVAKERQIGKSHQAYHLPRLRHKDDCLPLAGKPYRILVQVADRQPLPIQKTPVPKKAGFSVPECLRPEAGDSHKPLDRLRMKP